MEFYIGKTFPLITSMLKLKSKTKSKTKNKTKAKEQKSKTKMMFYERIEMMIRKAQQMMILKKKKLEEVQAVSFSSVLLLKLNILQIFQRSTYIYTNHIVT